MRLNLRSVDVGDLHRHDCWELDEDLPRWRTVRWRIEQQRRARRIGLGSDAYKIVHIDPEDTGRVR